MKRSRVRASAARGNRPGMRPCPVDGADTVAAFNKAVYQDNVQSCATVEPAIDLGASSPLAFARQVTGLT